MATDARRSASGQPRSGRLPAHGDRVARGHGASARRPDCRVGHVPDDALRSVVQRLAAELIVLGSRGRNSTSLAGSRLRNAR